MYEKKARLDHPAFTHFVATMAENPGLIYIHGYPFTMGYLSFLPHWAKFFVTEGGRGGFSHVVVHVKLDRSQGNDLLDSAESKKEARSCLWETQG